MRGVISAYAIYNNGVYKIVVECRDLDSFEILKRKMRLIGVFIVSEKGKGFV